jgi:hypothetical protein
MTEYDFTGIFAALEEVESQLKKQVAIKRRGKNVMTACWN